jgi:hypothetical protein
MSEANPFTASFEPPPSDGGGGGGGSSTPFANAAPEAESSAVPGRSALKRRVSDLNLGSPALLKKNPKVASLTVKDLDDLAAAFQGVQSANGKVASLSIDDMQDLEGIFLEYKQNAARELTGMSAEEVSAEWSVSCCCCTPCCSCAATEIEPIRA